MCKIEQSHAYGACSTLILYFMSGMTPLKVLSSLRGYFDIDGTGPQKLITCNYENEPYRLSDFSMVFCSLAYSGNTGTAKADATINYVKHLAEMGFTPVGEKWQHNKKNNSYVMLFTVPVPVFIEKLSAYIPELLEMEEKLRLRKEEQARRREENQREAMERLVRENQERLEQSQALGVIA